MNKFVRSVVIHNENCKYIFVRAQHLAEILTSRGFPAECISGKSIQNFPILLNFCVNVT